MSADQQIFQTSSKIRWNTFKWLGRLALFFLILMIPIVWIAMGTVNNTLLPGLSKSDYVKINLSPANSFNKRENKKYHGYDDFLKVKKQNTLLINEEAKKPLVSSVRAAFYVDWDPQALFSLQKHISSLNMVLPEWFFIDPVGDTLKTDIDKLAYDLMKKQGVKILPMLNNVNLTNHDGAFDRKLLTTVLADKTKRAKLLVDVVNKLVQYNLQGINIDFEELDGKTAALVHAFQIELYKRLHAKGMLVTQDVMVANDDYNLQELNNCNDYLFLMAYDQHYSGSVPGTVSEQRWVEKELDEAAKKIPSEKLILGMAAYGYDWPDSAAATVVTYQEAISTAREFNATIDFDNDTYNCTYQYKDYNNIHHTVYFMDAAGTYNSVRFADQYGTGGVALWRLGAEDERVWKFYNRDLTNSSLAKDPFSFSKLSSINITTEDPDFVGDGEILDVVSEPQKGTINIEEDTVEHLISEEVYATLPTRYVIKRFGQVHNQVILTFDDGPDPDYTPRILDILKKENVPAAFFIVGINGEAHLPLLKRIYREGFEIGNHSFTHPNMATISGSRAATEMEATRLLIESTTGRSTILFRAPYNADAEPTKAVELKPVARAQKSSYYTVGESIDPEDWDVDHGINADSIYNRVVRRYESNTPKKGIILLHDAGGNREATVQALPNIIHYFKSKGIQFASVGNLLGLSKDVVMPPVHSSLINVNSWVMSFIYWISRFLLTAFWLAIFLGLGKIIIMAILATLQYLKAKKEVLQLKDTVPGKVSIIVPAYNEEVNAVKTVQNLLQQDYPDFEIIFIDDGSKDATYKIVSAAFESNEKVSVVTKPNGGKASALNYGINLATGSYVVCIDADTQLLNDAVRQLMKYFINEKVVAVAGNVKVGNEKNILTRWQSIEYTTAQNFDRLAFDYLNCITVVPGAIGAFNKEAIIKAGGFTTDTLAEDCDLTLRLLRNGGVVRNCTKAVAVTEAPETLNQFMKQRFRWSYGIMQSFWKNKDACFNPKYKSMGIIALPNILLFQILMPIIAPIADILFFFSIAWSWHDPESLQRIFLFYGLFLLVDIGVSVMAFAFEKAKFFKLLWIILQRFVYRQLMYVILFRSFKKAIKGEAQNWGVLKRTGNVVIANSQQNSLQAQAK